jgi:hypothetical protein
MDTGPFERRVAFLSEVHFCEPVSQMFAIFEGVSVYIAVIESAHVLATIVVIVIPVASGEIRSAWMPQIHDKKSTFHRELSIIVRDSHLRS